MATTLINYLKKKGRPPGPLYRQGSVIRSTTVDDNPTESKLHIWLSWKVRQVDSRSKINCDFFRVLFLRLLSLFIFLMTIIIIITTMPSQFDNSNIVEGRTNNVPEDNDHNQTAPKYQNTYRLESYKPFNVDMVDKIIKQVMINNLEDIVYDPKECPRLCGEISEDIRDRIKRLNFDRYKIVVIVTINEKASQAIQSSMRFIWDVERDNYSTFTFETRTFFAYCCVFGVYYE